MAAKKIHAAKLARLETRVRVIRGMNRLVGIVLGISVGFVVVAAGGGGIPVIRGEDGELKGVDAVVDKDLTAAMLAWEWGAQLLIIPTAVDQVFLDYRTPASRPLTRVTAAEIKDYIAQGQFETGSMLPKMEAAVEFIANGGKRTIITDPPNLLRAVNGETGTTIVA